jgi:DNA-binding NtrC family response regulator
MHRNVLLVDDEPSLLDGLRRSLRAEDFSVHIADSAEAAMDVLQQRSIDVVVSDDAMPGVSGVDFLAQIHILYPATMRIMLTGQATIERMHQAVNEGNVFRFLLKPCPYQVLVEAVHHALDHKLLRDRGSEAIATMRTQGTILRWLSEHHPQQLAAAIQAIAGIHLRPDDFLTANEVVDGMEVEIRNLDQLHPALERRPAQTSGTPEHRVT